MPDVTDPIDPHVLFELAGVRALEQLNELPSTMDRARELALDPAVPLPAVVVADRQTQGRGRRGARWWQPPGSLAVSIVIDGASLGAGAAEPRPVWSLACGVAVAESLAALEPALEPLVRWPNDVEARGRKLAGIIVETAPGGRAIFGIGVNTTGTAAAAPAALRGRIATVPDLVGRSMPRETLLVELLPRLLALLAEITADAGRLVGRYRPLCSLTGSDVTVFNGSGAPAGSTSAAAQRRISGRCQGIDVDGALVVETVAGRLHLASGSLTDPADVWHGEASAAPPV